MSVRALLHDTFSRVRSAFSRLLERWRQARREARAIAELEALDDRTLRDIGIAHRSQIRAFLKEARARERRVSERSNVVDIHGCRMREASSVCDRAV